MSHTEKTIDSTRIFEGRSSACVEISWNWKTANRRFERSSTIRAGLVFWQWIKKEKSFLSGSSAIHLAKCCWNCLLESWSREKILPRADAENCGRKPAAPQVGLNPWAV